MKTLNKKVQEALIDRLRARMAGERLVGEMRDRTKGEKEIRKARLSVWSEAMDLVAEAPFSDGEEVGE